MGQYKDGDSRTINGVTYVRQGGQWMPSGPAVGPAIGNNPLIPGQLQGQGLNNTGQGLQNVRTQQQIDYQPLQNASTQANIAQTQTQIHNTQLDNLNNLRKQFEALQSVQDYRTVLPQFGAAMNAKDNKAGDLQLIYAFGKIMDPNSVVREGELGMAQDVGGISERVKGYLNSVQGQGRLTTEQRKELMGEIHNRLSSISDAYNQQREFYRGLAGHEGINPEDVVGPHPGVPFQQAEANFLGRPVRNANGTLGPAPTNLPPGSNPQGPALVMPPVGSAAQTGLAGQAGYTISPDESSASFWEQAARQGTPYGMALRQWQSDVKARGLQGVTPPPPEGYNKARTFIRNHPDIEYHPFSSITRTPQGEAPGPLGAARDLLNTSGVMDTGPGAFIGRGADKFAAGIPTRLAGNQGRLFNAFTEDNHPTASILGDIAGTTAGALTANRAVGAAAPRLGFLASNPGRQALTSDMLFGGAGGAAQDDQNNPLLGAGEGALAMGTGNIAGRGLAAGLAGALSPTGGRLAPLYAMGVRPSIGQRMGGAINNFEEKLQSVPLLGDMIAGTRGRAVDQYQLGLFNDSLGHIGKELPKETVPGHGPHRFAQDAISDAYDGALANMTAAADGQLSQDLGGVQRAAGQLKQGSQSQFKKIWEDEVARRFKLGGGAISGDAYKDMESALSQKVAAIRNSQSGDGELADALEQSIGALRGSAMRNSAPDAIAALDNADAAHAKLVRIENASRTASGEPAEFSPRQYATATKNSSGGVRNRQYLRGDALNAELATLGNQLGDKVSNSGSIDRLLAGGALYGLNSVSPPSAAALTGLTALNAPGVRNLVTGILTPRDNPALRGLADSIRKRSGMFGALGAGTSLPLLLPSQ